jgi:hypothetical protein
VVPRVKGVGVGVNCGVCVQKGFGSTFVLFEGFKKLQATTFAPQ